MEKDSSILQTISLDLNETKHNTDFLNYAFHAQTEIIMAYSNLDFEKYNNLINKVEQMSENDIRDKLTLHYFYQDLANKVYSMRYNNDCAISDCLTLCDKDIELLTPYKFDSFISVTTITKKAIILEKQSKYEEAIAVCEFGLERDFLDNGLPFSARKSRLARKIKPPKTENGYWKS